MIRINISIIEDELVIIEISNNYQRQANRGDPDQSLVSAKISQWKAKSMANRKDEQLVDIKMLN